MRALGLLCKNPHTRPVKTRLAARVGQIKALEMYQVLLIRSLDLVLGLEHTQSIISVDGGSDFLPVHQALVFSQCEGGLGQRIGHFFQNSLQEYNPVILIGTDCPSLQPADLEEAFSALEQASVVFKPAADGGYVLIGLTEYIPELFASHLPWSQETLLRVSCAVLDDLGICYTVLQPSFDIDELADWERWQNKL